MVKEVQNVGPGRLGLLRRTPESGVFSAIQS